jgi:hypothetical protein
MMAHIHLVSRRSADRTGRTPEGVKMMVKIIFVLRFWRVTITVARRR